MRIIRIFLKPNGVNWFDYALGDQTIHQFEARWKTDKTLVHDSGMVPYKSMLFAYTIDIAVSGQEHNPNAPPKPTVVPMKPVQPWGLPPNPEGSK